MRDIGEEGSAQGRLGASCSSRPQALEWAWLSPAAVIHWLPALVTHLSGKAWLCLAAQVPSLFLLRGKCEPGTAPQTPALHPLPWGLPPPCKAKHVIGL